jgi:hypothetical protein
MVLFHLGFFLLSGVLFLKWILVLLAIIILLVALDRDFLFQSFWRYRRSFPVLLVVATLIGLIPYRPIVWGGTKYNVDYDMIAITETGKRYELSEKTFHPYGRYFSQSHLNFAFLVNDRKMLGPSYFDYEVARELNRLLDSPASVNRVRQQYGFRAYHEESAAFFDRFIKRYVHNFYRSGKDRPFGMLQYPLRYLSALSTKKYDLEEIPGRIVRVVVKMEEAYFNGRRNVQVEESIVRDVTIPQSDTLSSRTR